MAPGESCKLYCRVSHIESEQCDDDLSSTSQVQEEEMSDGGSGGVDVVVHFGLTVHV